VSVQGVKQQQLQLSKKSEAKSKTRGRTRILCIKRQMREIERVGKCVCVWDAAG